jgi:hypothetical protein
MMEKTGKAEKSLDDWLSVDEGGGKFEMIFFFFKIRFESDEFNIFHFHFANRMFQTQILF